MRGRRRIDIHGESSRMNHEGTVTVNEKADKHSHFPALLNAVNHAPTDVGQDSARALAPQEYLWHKKNVVTRLVAFIAALVAMVLMLAGCGTTSTSTSSTNSADGAKSANQTITVYGCEPAKPLIPSSSYEQCGDMPASMLFVGLTVYDKNGSIHNEIARTITPSDENRTWTIRLRPWKFQDGTAVTAQSFARAWSYAANAANGQVTNDLFSIVQGYDALNTKGVSKNAQLSGVTTPDRETIVVHLNTPTASFPYRVGFWAWAPLPNSFYRNPKRYGQHPIGTGPYRFVSWTHDQQIRLARDPSYHGYFHVRNSGITFKEYTDPNAAYSDLQAGHLDAMGVIPTEATKTYLHDTSIVAYNAPGTDWESVTIPEDLPHFRQNKEGRLRRQAISMAIDRKAICTKVLGGTASTPTDFLTPMIVGHVSHIGDLKNSHNIVYNPSKARKLWKQANTISRWDTATQLKMFFNADTGGGKAVFTAVANSVSNVLGIRTLPQAVPTYQDYLTREQNNKLHGMFRDMWSPDYPYAENLLASIYTSWATYTKGANRSLYNNKAYDRLITQAAEQTDQKKAISLYHQAEEILLDDLPAIPLYYGNSAGAHTKNITGFAMNWSNQIVYPSLRRK